MGEEERRSLGLAGALCLGVPLLWLALGWRPDRLVGGNDLALLLVPAMQRLLAVGGDFDAFVYDPTWLGGSDLVDVLGALPLHRVLAAWPLSAVGLLNLTAFFAQVLYGHLVARGTLGVWTLIARADRSPRPGATELGFGAQLGIGLLAAFTPLVAWRIAYGHLYILFGALALPAALSLFALSRAGRLTITCVVMALLAFAHALPHVGQQPVLYGIVFGAPLLLGLALEARPAATELRRAAAALGLAMLAGLLVSLPRLVAMLRHFAGPDAPRGFGAGSFTYSYLVATPVDWLGSLFWVVPPVEDGRSAFTLHETNYALGPLVLGLLALALVARRLALGVLASWLLVVVFASRVPLASEALLALVPPLHLFRIPARAALPVGLAVLPVALAALCQLWPRALSSRRQLAWLLLVPVSLSLPRWGAELAAWCCVLALVLPHRFAPPRPLAIAVLLAASLAAFGQRLLPLPSRAQLIDEPARLGQLVKQQRPELRSPLVRLVGQAETRPNNILYSAGLSSLGGYGLVNARLLRLLAALRGQPYEPHVSVVQVDPRAPHFPLLSALYNLRAYLAYARGRLAPLPARGRALWLSRGLASSPSLPALLEGLSPEALAERSLYVKADPAARSLRETACQTTAQVRLQEVSSAPFSLRARLPADRTGTCPLNVATTFSDDLEVRGRASSGAPWVRLRTYPAYGALLGALVPPRVREVEVRARPREGLWQGPTVGVGLLLSLALCLWAPREPPRHTRAGSQPGG